MSRDHSQNHYGPNASFDGYDSDLASAGILIESLRQQLNDSQKREVMLRDALQADNAELVAVLELLSKYIAYNGDDWVQRTALEALAKVRKP